MKIMSQRKILFYGQTAHKVLEANYLNFFNHLLSSSLRLLLLLLTEVEYLKLLLKNKLKCMYPSLCLYSSEY